MNPASKAKAILTALSDAPATAPELAAELGMKRCYVGPTLIEMWRKGYATRSIFTRGPSGPAPFMYQISELGLLKIAAREPHPMTTETQCGRIGFQTVSECAERAAHAVCGFLTASAVCLSPDGFVTVEAIEHAIPDDIVGVYTARSSVELWLQISGDMAVAMYERGITGGRRIGIG